MALVDYDAAFSPLEMQKSMLEMNPHADYILWGNIGTPDVPHAVRFLDHTTGVTFRIHRGQVFRRDGDDIDSLVYLLMTLIPAARPTDSPEEILCAQLGRKFPPHFWFRIQDQYRRRRQRDDHATIMRYKFAVRAPE